MSDTSPAVPDRDRLSPDLRRPWRTYLPSLGIHLPSFPRTATSPIIAMLAPTTLAASREAAGLRGEFEDEVD